MPIRIVLADDHQVVRQGLKVLLEQKGCTVVGEASDGHATVQLVKQLHPEVVVMDLGMPLLNGIDAAREIRKALPKTPTIMLTMHAEEQYVLEALRAGVRGFVLKSEAATDLIRAIQEVVGGSTYLSPRVSKSVVQAYLNKTDIPEDPLSDRERQVLQLIAEGKSTKEIATLLSVSAKTVESHRLRLTTKLNTHGIAGLVRYAVRSGLIEP